MFLPIVAILVGAVVGFVGSRRLRRPSHAAPAASVARPLGSPVIRRRTLTPPELQRACFSEMVRHVQVSRRGETRAPSCYLLRLNPIDLEVVDDGRRWFTDGLVDALRTAAKENDWLLDGDIEITYEPDPSRRPGIPSASALDGNVPPSTPPSASSPPRAASPAGSSGDATRLVLRRADTGDTIPLGDDAVTIGRSRDRSITIADDRVSRNHARIEAGRDGWTLTDEGSSNGTRLGGEELAPGVAKHLSAGDVIGVGPVDIHVDAAPGRPREAGARALDDHTRTRISGEVLRPKREER